MQIQSVYNIDQIAHDMYKATCRVGLSAPGFYLVDLGKNLSSTEFRECMLAIKTQMACIHKKRTNQTLIYLSAGRFDQQETTKPHLDGAPKESLLMLGYEPSAIESSIEMIDYTKCAYEKGMTPDEFMQQYNPMYETNIKILQPYKDLLKDFNKNHFQIVCINNSHAPYSTQKNNWQGVLHTANIPYPDPSKQRIINSTMIAPAPKDAIDAITQEEIEYFVHTNEIKQKWW